MSFFNAGNVLKQNRWPWLDYDKGISIILVGYAHCFFCLAGYGPRLQDYPLINFIDVFLYGFRMPLFFIVSGLLTIRSVRKKGTRGYIHHRFDTILYPMFVWGFIEISLKILYARVNPASAGNTTSAMDYLNLIIDPRQTGHFWYLNALFCIGVLYVVLRAWWKFTPAMQVILGLIFYSISAYLHIHHIKAGILTDVFEYYFFFALGDFLSGWMLKEKNTRYYASWKLFLPLLMLFVGVQYYCTTINLRPGKEGISYVEHQLPLLFLFQVLLGCAMSISFSFMLQRYNTLKFLRIVGYHSLYVYCMQIIAMTFARIIYFKILKITYVPVLFPLVWVTGVALPIVFYNLTRKAGMWWLFTAERPRSRLRRRKGQTSLAVEGS